MKNKIFSQSATVLLTAALLQACGGGGGGDSAPAATNTAPTNVSLVEASSAGSTVVTASWLPATDDSTTATNLNYEIHASTDPNFVPSASTLKLKGANLASARIDGLLPSTQYTLKLVVLDKDGLKTVSNSLQVTTSSTPSEQMAGVTVKTMAAGQTLAMTDTSLTLAAGAPVPKVGEFVASAEGDGYLRKVVAVNVVDGKTVVSTQKAALNQVLSAAELSSSFKLKSVPAELPIVQAGLSVQAQAISKQVSYDWTDTGFSLTTNTHAVSHSQPLALQQAGVANVTAEAVFQQSTQYKPYQSPHAEINTNTAVSVLKGKSGNFNVSFRKTSDDTEWVFPSLSGFTQPVPLMLCEIGSYPYGSEIKVDHDGVTTHGLVTLGNLTRSPDSPDVYAQKTINIDASGINESSDKPYTVTLYGYVNKKETGCTGAEHERVKFEFDIYVTDDLSASSSTAEESQEMENGSQATVKNKFTYTFDPKVNTNIILKRPESGISVSNLNSATIEVATNPTITQTLTINATAAATLKPKTMPLFTRDFKKVYLAGSIPVVVTGTFTVDATITGKINGELNAKESITLGYKELSYGLIFKDGKYDVFSKKQPTYQFTIEGKGKANAEITVTLTPRLRVSVYEAATGILAVEPYLRGNAGIEGEALLQVSELGKCITADYRVNPVDIHGGINAYARADFSIMDYTIAEWPNTEGDNIKSRSFSFKAGEEAKSASYRELKVIDDTRIMGLPDLSTKWIDTAIPLSATGITRRLLIRGTYGEVNNPFSTQAIPLNPLIKFVTWLPPKVVCQGATSLPEPPISSSPSIEPNATDVWLTYDTKPASYKVRLAAQNSLGSLIRQYTDIVVTLTDDDNDGMIDQWEQIFGVTNPSDDPDGDGRNNLEEFKAGTNPTVKDSELTAVDTDKDGMPDTWEQQYGLNPTEATDATQDPDGDKITNVNEYKAGTNPKLADANALLKVSNASPTVNTAVSFSLATVFDSVKSIVWKFGETVVSVVENLADAISKMFNTVGDVLVSATLKDSTGAEITTVSTTVSVKPLVCPNGQVEQGGKCVDVTPSVFEDNFNDNINGVTAGNWTAVVEGTNPSVQEANQRLEITLPANSVDSSKQVFEAGYQNTCQLEGDFDVQVDYDLLDFPSYNGARVGLTVGDRARQSNTLYTVHRTSFSSHDAVSAREELGVNFTNTFGGVDVAGNTKGTLRLQRVGNTLYGYGYLNGGWQLLDSNTISTAALPVTISAWGNNGYFDNKNVKVAFDNFKVTKGALVGASCKANGGMSGSFTVPATSSTGIAFVSPSSTKPLQCGFTATGEWNFAAGSPSDTYGPQGSPTIMNAYYVAPEFHGGALIAKTNESGYVLIGNGATLSVAPNAVLHFLSNDGPTWYYNNQGSVSVTYICSEIPQPTWKTNPANGHQYAAADCGTWTQCEAQAVALGAHLVSVNDAAENAWLVSTFTPDKNYWIGLTDKDQEGVWKWTSGEAFGYSNWVTGEPNNGYGGTANESYVHMNFNYPSRTNVIGKWNDTQNDITGTGIGGIPYNSSAMGVFEKSSSSNYSIEWHYPNIGTLITGRGTNPVSVITSDAVEVTGFMDNAKFDVDVIGNKVKLFNFRSYSGYPNTATMTTASFNGFVLRAVNGAFSSATITIDNNGDGDYLDAGELAPASSKITIGADYIAANLSGLSYSPTTVMYIDFQPL